MNIHLLINEKFDELYEKNKRCIDLSSDLNLSIGTSEIKNFIDESNLYYKLTAKRYIKTEWIIMRMNEYLETESYFIDKEIAEIIVRDISKTRTINRNTLREIFFSDIDVITKYELDIINNNILKRQDELNIDNKARKTNENEKEKLLYQKLFKDMEFDSSLDKNLTSAYFYYRIIYKIGQVQALKSLVNNVKFYDIRELCQYCRVAGFDTNIKDVISIIGLKRTGIYGLDPITSKRKSIPIIFEDSVNDLKNQIKSRDWDCYYNYVIDKSFTLDEIGSIFNISRERVRQIVRKVDRIVKKHKYLFYPFKEYLDVIFTYQDYIPIEKLLQSTLVYMGSSLEDLSVELNLLNYLFNTNYHIFEGNLYNFNKKEIEDLIMAEIFDNESVECKILLKEELYIHINNLNFKDPSKIIKYLIQLTNNIIFSDTEDYVFIKRKRLTNIDICKWILYNIGEPTHYSIIHEKYCEYEENDDMTLRSLHATLDRAGEQGIIRTFTGTYGLIELGAEKHVFARDLVIKVLNEFKRPMHYSEIIKEVQKYSDAKENTIYANLNTTPEIISNNDGVYALKIWKEKLDESFQEKKEVERKLIKHGYNKYNNYTIKYLVKNKIFDDYTLRLPLNIPLKLDSIVNVVNTNNDVFVIKYNNKFNYLYRFDRVLYISKIKHREYIFLELISPDYIRVFKEHEYYMYLDGELILCDEKEKNHNIQKQDIDSLLSIFYKEV